MCDVKNMIINFNLVNQSSIKNFKKWIKMGVMSCRWKMQEQVSNEVEKRWWRSKCVMRKARESISGWGFGVGVGDIHPPHILLNSSENAPPTPPCNLQEPWHDIGRPSFLLRILWSCWLLNVLSRTENPRCQSPRDVPALSVFFLFGASSCRLTDIGVERSATCCAPS